MIWHHTASGTGAWRGSSMGFLGVDLFFVISGFLIVTLLLREQAAENTISLRRFYLRRTLRIFPLYYGFIILLFCFYYFLNPDSSFGRRFVDEIFLYLTYTANFFPVAFAIVWSLCMEEQFYLMWPTIEKYLRRFVIPILVIALVCNQIVNFPAGKDWISTAIGSDMWTGLSMVQATFTPLLLGVLAAHLLHSDSWYERSRFLVGHYICSWIWISIILALCTFSPEDISGPFRLSIQLSMMFLVMSCVCREDNGVAGLLSNKGISFIGRISYGMYLFHIHAIVVTGAILHRVGLDVGEPSAVLFLAATILTCIAAAVSYFVYERPFLRLKRRFSVVKQQHM